MSGLEVKPLVWQARQSGTVARVDGDGAGSAGGNIADEHQRCCQTSSEIYSHTVELNRDMDAGLIRER